MCISCRSLTLFQRLRWRRTFLKPGYTIATNALHPKSRGRISLNTRSILDQPKIEPNYFAHPDDVRTIVASARLALRLGLSPPFRRRGARVFDTPSPHCRHLRLFSDAYFACIIREDADMTDRSSFIIRAYTGWPWWLHTLFGLT